MFQSLNKVFYLGEIKGDRDVPYIMSLFFKSKGKRRAIIISYSQGKQRYLGDTFFLSNICKDILPDVVIRLKRFHNENFHNPDYEKLAKKELHWARGFIYVGAGADLIGHNFDYILKMGLDTFIEEIVKITRSVFDWLNTGKCVANVGHKNEHLMFGPSNKPYDPDKEKMVSTMTPILIYTEDISLEKGEFYLHLRQGNEHDKVIVTYSSFPNFVGTLNQSLRQFADDADLETERFLMGPVADFDTGQTMELNKLKSHYDAMAICFNDEGTIVIPAEKDVIDELCFSISAVIGRRIDSVTLEDLKKKVL